MKFVEMIERLQEDLRGTVIFVRNGIFFVAIGKDAIFLSEKLGLKRTCMKENMCKVGFQVKSADRYIEKLKQENISFALYDMDKNRKVPEQIYRYIGEDHQEEKVCLNCSSCGMKQETDEDVINKIRNMK